MISLEPCPVGFEGVGVLCKPCPINTYELDSKCEPCLAGTATNFERSIQCTKACGHGEFLTIAGQCVKCGYGRYQSLARHSQTECLYCPNGLSTVREGASSEGDCLVSKGSFMTLFQ